MSVYHDKSEHFNALQMFLCTPAKIINGIGYVFSNGEWRPEKEYKEQVSRPRYEPPPRDNADKQNISSEVITKKRK